MWPDGACATRRTNSPSCRYFHKFKHQTSTEGCTNAAEPDDLVPTPSPNRLVTAAGATDSYRLASWGYTGSNHLNAETVNLGVELLVLPGVVHHELAGSELLAVLVRQAVHHVRVRTWREKSTSKTSPGRVSTLIRATPTEHFMPPALPLLRELRRGTFCIHRRKDAKN